MIRRLTLATVLLSSLALATQGGKIVFSTGQGKWTISQLSSWSIMAPPKSDKITFQFKGSPLRVANELDGSSVTATSAVGRAHRAGAETVLDQIDLGGGVNAARKSGATEVQMRAATATITTTGKMEKTLLKGNLYVMQTNEKGTKVTIEGSEGTINTKKGAGAVGNVSGPVTIHINYLSSGTPGKLVATSDRMSFDLAQEPYHVTLSGNVHMKGDQSQYAGDSTANEMVIVLDKSYQPVEFRGKGDPGTTTLERGNG